MEAIKELSKVDLFSWFITLLVIASAFTWIVKLAGEVSNILNKPFKWVKKKNEDHELLIKTAQTLSTLQEKEVNDVNESIRHDEMIRKDLSDLSIIVGELKEEVTLMRTLRDNDKMAEYKDRLRAVYSAYSCRKYSEEEPVPYWNTMEKEALEGLIKQYEAHGGKNSFVHSVIEPSVATFKIIDIK